MTDLAARIAAYLSGGGLFNPELANHDAVRDLIIDCRARIEELEKERDEALAKAERQWAGWVKAGVRIEELEKALEPIAAMQPILARPLVAGATDMPDDAYVGSGITYGMLRTAARALKKGPGT
jgi:hypothetical protein